MKRILQSGDSGYLPLLVQLCSRRGVSGAPPPVDGPGGGEGPSSTPRKRARRRGLRKRSLRRHQSDATAAAVDKEKGDPLGLEGVRVPRSLDVGEVEAFMDVEKFFPEAMTHLRSAPPQSAYLADEKARREWRDVTHAYNADGIRLADRTEAAAEYRAPPSFFHQASLDIRGSMAFDEEGKPRAHAFPSPEQAAAPDILQLTGGDPQRHRPGSLSDRPSAGAANTLADEGSGAPVELTDMLRERMMELTAEKIKEDRNDTFMPRRLPLVSDAELSRRQQQQRAEGAALSGPRGRRSRVATLADAAAAATGAEEEEEGGAADRRLPAVRRDGHTEAQARRAEVALQGAEGFTPVGIADGDAFADLERAMGRHQRPPSDAASAAGDGVYLLRTLPRAGLCSRREAHVVIATGQVKVNNVVERNPFRPVRAEDDIHVAGHRARLRFAPPRLYMYHKPANVVVARSDPQGRRLITRHARLLGLDHLVPVGSLPLRAHGVLMLTNDGELAHFLESPASKIQQTYLLRVRPAVDPVLAHKLNVQGVNINGRQHRGFEFIVNPAARSRYSLKVKLRGEAMPVAHLMQHLGRVVERGGRVSFGPFALGTLAVGSVRQVTVPPHYAQHVGAAWEPFVERDWPYFRRERVRRLRRLSQFRELTPKELEELDSYTYEEIKDALSFDARETRVAEEAARRQAALAEPPEVGQAIAFPFGKNAAATSEDIHVPYDDEIVEDITSLQ